MSDAELLLATQLEQAGIPFEREYVFAPPRKWRADFHVWPNGHFAVLASRPDILVEVEGGAFVHGRHTRGAAFEKDCEKYAAAAIRAFRVVRVTPRQVNEGLALEWIRQALGLEKAA